MVCRAVLCSAGVFCSASCGVLWRCCYGVLRRTFYLHVTMTKVCRAYDEQFQPAYARDGKDENQILFKS